MNDLKITITLIANGRRVEKSLAVLSCLSGLKSEHMRQERKWWWYERSWRGGSVDQFAQNILYACMEFLISNITM